MTAWNSEPNARVPTPRVSSRQMERLVAKFETMLKRSGDVAVERFGEEAAAGMRKEILDEYRRLIPEVPYIGGRRNMYSRTLMGAPQPLAIHRVVIRHGGTVLDTGEFLHRWLRARLERLPHVLRHLMRRYQFSRARIRQYERTARRSQQRQYPGDWVLAMLDNDGQSFDWGFHITECGIAKFLHDQGADELTPFICDLDHVLAEVAGYGLERTKTLAWGCDRCDFRYTKHGEASAPWPPQFIEQTCGEPAAQDSGPSDLSRDR